MKIPDQSAPPNPLTVRRGELHVEQQQLKGGTKMSTMKPAIRKGITVVFVLCLSPIASIVFAGDPFLVNTGKIVSISKNEISIKNDSDAKPVSYSLTQDTLIFRTKSVIPQDCIGVADFIFDKPPALSDVRASIKDLTIGDKNVSVVVSASKAGVIAIVKEGLWSRNGKINKATLRCYQK